MQIESGSYRDPRGSIFYHDNNVYRSVDQHIASEVRNLFSSGLVEQLVSKNYLVHSSLLDENQARQFIDNGLVIQHKKLEMISYPYEWSFEQLQTAALHHLDLHLFLLKKNYTLSDATAYNVQFDIEGCKPVFIDLLSIVPYHEGEYWLAQSQFCSQFLAPLVFSANTGISFNNWYRGNLEGIALEDLAALLPFKSRFSLTLLLNIFLPAYFQKKKSDSRKKVNSEAAKLAQRPFPKTALVSNLQRLRKYISSLENKRQQTVWGNYADENSYIEESVRQKRDFIKAFAKKNNGKRLWDIGCNRGDYSTIALENGIKNVVGLDFDISAISAAFQDAKENQKSFLPLFFDVANPSGNLGWYQTERKGVLERANADCLIALAFIHHLCIAKNIPIEQAIDWLLDIAPEGIIEFVGKEDETTCEMLALREDIFPDYHYENFCKLLKAKAEIVTELKLPESDRTLVHYRLKTNPDKT